MRVLISGATSWTDAAALRREMARLPKDTVVVTGDTAGIDALAIGIAAELGFTAEAMRKNKADYKRHPQAGWKGLNERMLASGIDLVLAFHPDYDTPGCARGTRHAVELAQAAGIQARVFLR